MRKTFFFLTLMAVIWGTLQARAYETETIQNYTYDFSDPSLTPANYTSIAHDWAPAGWSHIIDSYEGDYNTYYVDYFYIGTEGVDGSSCIRVGDQQIGGYGYEGYDATDLLVTPLVSGTVTLQVKAYGYYGGEIKFYNVNDSDNSMFAGTQITDTTRSGEVNPNSYVTVTVNVGSTPKRIGIRASDAYIDNFTATTAYIEKIPALKISGVKQLSADYIDTDSDGNFTVQFKAAVVNTGLADLAPGDEGYSLDLVNYTDSSLVKNVPITVALAQGTSDSIDVSAQLNVSQYPTEESARFNIRENVSGTYHFAGRAIPVAYAPQFSIRSSDASRLSSLEDNANIDFGMSAKPVSRQYVISNNGAKSLNITSVSMPTGFVVSPTAPLNIAAHKDTTITVTMTTDVFGTKQGVATFSMDELEDFHLNFSGTVADSTKFFVNFEDGVIPATFIPQSNWEISTWPLQAGIPGNTSCAIQRTTSDSTKLITPKLNVVKGENLSFQAGKINGTSHLEVLYSTDRQHWTLVKSINDDEATLEENRFSDDNIVTSWSTNFALKTFTISGIPAGEKYIAFQAGGVHLDNIYGFTAVSVPHDIVVTSLTAPKTAMVNHTAAFAATIKNANDKTEDADSYTAKLIFGGNTYEGQATQLIAGATKDYTFSVTPHQAGKLPAVFVVTAKDGSVSTSDTVYVDVSQESASNRQQVGTPDANSAGNEGVISPYYGNSQSVSVYTSSDINLPAGSAIHGITYRGYLREGVAKNLQLYIRNTDKTELTADDAMTEIADTANFTKVYDDDYDLAPGGSGSLSYSSSTIDEAADLIHIDFAQPFIYTGNGIEIAANASNSNWKNIAWERSAVLNQSAVRHNDGSLPEYFSLSREPVVYLDVERTPSTVSGTVTSASTSQPVADVVVKFVNDNVEYSDTTDANGKYNVTVIQDALKYQLTASKAGYTPYVKDTLNLAGQHTIDFAIADASGFFIENKNFPSNGMVNYAYTATVKALNTEATPIDSAAYTAKLYFGNEVVAESEAPAVASGADHDYTFTFTPHEAGQYKAFVELAYGDKVTRTDTVDVKVAEEETAKEVVVNNATGTSNKIPLNLFYKNSESELIYTAAQLGLPTGVRIKRIAIRGYQSGSKNFTATYSAFIENTNDDAPQSADVNIVDTLSMTRIAGDSVIDLNVTRGSATNHVNMLAINIPDGFVYTGGNIRLVFHHEASSYLSNFYFDVDNTVPTSQSVMRQNDNNLADSYFSTISDGQPVLYLDVQSDGEVSGKVINTNGEGISGAKVTLNNNDVIYSAVTDDEGNYTVPVKQIDKAYDVTVSADGYATLVKEGAIVFDGTTSVVDNDTLLKVVSVSGTVTGVNVVNGVLNAEPIEGATVTVKFNGKQSGDNAALAKQEPAIGDVVATSTTDANGNYTIDGLVEGNQYLLVFNASGYQSDSIVTTIDAENATVTANDTLYTEDALGINGITAGSKSNVKGAVYTISGQYLGRNINVATLRSGIYIIDGKKITIK